MMIKEQELVGRILAGDLAAEGQFYGHFTPRLYRESMHLLAGNRPQAEEAVRESLRSAVSKLGAWDGRSPLYAWLRQICVRQSYAMLRAQNRGVLVPWTALSQPEGVSQESDWISEALALGLG